MKKPVIIALVIAALCALLICCIAACAILYSFFAAYSTRPLTTPPGQPVACTLEAKLCPDGSYVGRTGPKCEFTACPATDGPQTIACTNEVKECADGSFVARHGPNCEFDACPSTEDQVFCTLDIKLCSDGVTYVSRTGPKCEFEACP